MLELTFTELLAIIGAAQAVYILVAMIMRPAVRSKSFIAILFFAVLFLSFALAAIERNFMTFPIMSFFLDAVWVSLPFLCVVLLRDIAGTPSRRSKIFLFLSIPLCFALAWVLGSLQPNCGFTLWCDRDVRLDALSICGVVMGAGALLSLWGKRDLIVQTQSDPVTGQARYWLVLSTIVIVTVLLLIFMFDAANLITRHDAILSRTILGLTLVYLTMTSLFRVFVDKAQIFIPSRKSEPSQPVALSDAEKDIALKIETLMNLEKVYQEPSYSRRILAKELDLPESIISRIVNIHFQKSVPQLLNELRVGDAKRLLTETPEPISVIAEQSGFSSLASFNRVFKDVTGLTPSEFRNQKTS